MDPRFNATAIRDSSSFRRSTLRPLRSALEGLDLAALSREERAELKRLLVDTYQPLLAPPAEWKPSRRPRCPRVVAGMRCEEGHNWEDFDCICERYGGTGPLDHSRLWRVPTGALVLRGEPYYLDPEVLTTFVDECKELGLRLSVTGESSYFPGATVLVQVERERPSASDSPSHEGTSTAVRRQMLDDRVCFVCRRVIRDAAAFNSRLRIMTHQGRCAAIVEREERDFSRSERGRRRSPSEVRRRIEQADVARRIRPGGTDPDAAAPTIGEGGDL